MVTMPHVVTITHVVTMPHVVKITNVKTKKSRKQAKKAAIKDLKHEGHFLLKWTKRKNYKKEKEQNKNHLKPIHPSFV